MKLGGKSNPVPFLAIERIKKEGKINKLRYDYCFQKTNNHDPQ